MRIYHRGYMDINATVDIETEIFRIGSTIHLSSNEHRTMIYLAGKMQRETRIAIDIKESAEATNQSEKELIHALNHLRMKGIYSLDSRKKPKFVTRNRVYA